MPGFSYDELTKVPFVMDIISEWRAPGSSLQRFYNLGLTSTPGQTLPHRTGVYDIFNPTRGMPVSRPAMSGPARVARKPIGQKAITVPRFYEALSIEDEYVFRNRPLGGQYGTVDATGQKYISMQIAHETQKFVNLMEYMASQMFRGGWGLKAHGEDLLPVAKDDPDAVLTFDTLMPAEHQAQIPLRTGGADIIDVSWDDPTADLVQQFLILNKIHAARHGAPLRHVWLNGETMAPLFNNTKLQAVGGSVYRIFDSMSGRQLNPDEKYPDTGIDVKFRAMPEVTFHVYNQVIIPDLVSESKAAQFDMANVEYLISDNEVIITPDAGSWTDLVAGSEPVQHSLLEQAHVATGFDVGRARAIDPPRWDLKYLSNLCPVLVEQYSCYNPTVIFS